MSTKRKRNGAAIVLAGALLVAPACSNTPNRPGAAIGRAVGQEYIKYIEKHYGQTLEQQLDPAFIDSQYFSFSKEKLGFASEDPIEDYLPDQKLDGTSGPDALQVTVINGNIRIKDTSKDEVDDDAKLWLLQRIKQREEIIKAIASRNGFKQFNIKLNVSDAISESYGTQVKEMDGDATLENEMNLAFPRSQFVLSRELFDQMFMHEISHLIAGAISDDYLKHGKHKEQVERLQNVCAQIRSRAFEQVQPYLPPVADELREIASLTEFESFRASASALADIYDRGDLASIFPEADPYYVDVQEPQFGANSARCNSNSIIRQIGLMSSKLGFEFNRDESTAFNSSKASEHESNADELMYEAFSKNTIYQYLAEKNYVQGNNFGHGFDNLNEQIATAVALLSNPMDTGYKLKYIPTEDRELIIEFLDATSDLFVVAFPELRGMFTACREDLTKYLNGSYDPVTKACSPALAD
ncbi:MAG: hypothetical protein U0R17_06600 [Acidimicrobiia bacterium]